VIIHSISGLRGMIMRHIPAAEDKFAEVCAW
jgi:hypothetical protein